MTECIIFMLKWLILNLKISNCCNVCISHPRQLTDTNLELLKFLLKSLRNFDITVLMDNKQKATIH